MSLRIWLPLTKDLRQQGLDNVTVTNNGATFNSAGKLGGCYEFASGKRMQTTLPSISNLNSKAISFACWVNISSWNSSYDCLMSIADGTGWNQSRATLCRNNTASTLCWNIADGSTSTRVYTTTSLSTNTWYHIACTYDGVSLKIYVNGVLNNFAAATLSIGYAGTFNIGGWSGNNYPINCKMNDVRVYSHCLSPMEVKELAKGLVLHYPLNRQGWGQENLAKNSLVNISTTSYNTANFNLSEEIVSGASYTATLKGTLGSGKSYYGIWMGGGYTGVGQFTNNNNGTFTMHFTGPSSVAGNGSRTQINVYAVPSNNTDTCTIEWLKLEKSSVATPWCPNSSDTLATTMGLNSITEYDCSGFCNNGEKMGALTYTSDTPKYNVATYCPAGTGIFGHPNITFSQFTIAFWGKHSATGKMLMGSNASTSSVNTNWYWYGDNSFKYPGGEFYYSHNAGSADSLLNKWTHFVATYDGANVTVYRNGIYEGVKALTGTQTLEHVSIGNGYSSSSYWENGCVSDLRIYATALSADDVKSLYQNSAYIDSSGNVYGAVHTEV